MAEVPLEFEGKSLYEIFGVNRDASAEKIRKAYYKLALQWVCIVYVELGPLIEIV